MNEVLEEVGPIRKYSRCENSYTQPTLEPEIPKKRGRPKNGEEPQIPPKRTDGEILVGAAARRQAVTNPTKTIYSAKRFIGCKFPLPPRARG